MKARILPIDTDEHQRVQTLLPWYVNGTLDGDESLRVETHVADCVRCQADCALQQRLRALGELPGPLDDRTYADPVADDTAIHARAPDVDRDWAALRSRLEQDAAAPASSARAQVPLREAPAAARPTRRRWSQWQQLALGAQGALVCVLAAALVMVTRQAEPYRALAAAPTSSAANALVVFRPQATEAQIRAALRASDARLVGGPTVTDAYLLRVPAVDPQTLARLRADPAVLRIESLEAEGPK